MSIQLGIVNQPHTRLLVSKAQPTPVIIFPLINNYHTHPCADE